MQTIGERLEEARKRKGISIREAAETTKIRGDYLQKFEANSFDIDLPPLYIRGFLRSYALYLDLDPDRFVNDFNSVLAHEGKTLRRENREVYGRVDFGDAGRGPESAVPANGGGRSAQDQAVMLKFALLGGGALVAIVVIILLVNVLFSRSPAKPSASGQPAASTQAGPAESREHTLTLIARAPVRVKVARVSDNQVLFPGLTAMAAGETKTIRYSSKLKVTVDDPSKLIIEINGKREDVPIREYGYFFIEP